MAVKIRFDSQHNAQLPTLVLASRNGKLLGKLPCHNVQFKDKLNSYSELRFDVYKNECLRENDSTDPTSFWKQIKDFKLIWAREWNTMFEIYVELNESDETIKNVTAKSLGEAELSQISLYNIEINTETDIDRDDYKPTVLYNESDPQASLLHRIFDKAPHYRINHVDVGISNIQRTFSFNENTIYDATNTISEEINCLFIIKCYLDTDGKLIREVNVYDLESYCMECNTRGEFTKSCTKCGSTNIRPGYGKDTSIFISTENLAESITYSTDNGSVKNCFRLEAGDDLMTATLRSCNPNGSGYIWYISDETKEDMSPELVSKLNEYDHIYEYYDTENQVEIDNEILASYNALIEKYSEFSDKYAKAVSPIVGFPALIKEYYNTIDFYLFLNNSLMPNIEIPDTTAVLEAAKITPQNLSPVAVQDINSFSHATATSSVLAMAKTIVSKNYQVKISDSTLNGTTWTGTFVVTSFSDEEDTAVAENISISISGDYKTYVKQRIDKILSNSADDSVDIISLFNLDEGAFAYELKKYSLTRLTSFFNSCQSTIDILIGQGISDKKTWDEKEDDLYSDIYVPYYNKLKAIETEAKLRESEIATIIGSYDKNGILLANGIQTILQDSINTIQDQLNFEDFIGTDLWLEFASYRREDTYKNENYISDGLDNAELLQKALEFIDVSKKEIYKSSTRQHSISAPLKNLLVMKEFEPIVEYFEVGNWLRIKVDGKLNILRLLEYEINFNNLDSLSVSLSDVKTVKDGVTDIESVLNQASSMASSYGAISRQSKKGNDGNQQLKEWIENGLSLTTMKIVNNADNQNISMDDHGLLCKEYSPITDTYDSQQLKLINKGLYVTDDNWLTSRAGIGNYVFYNPETKKYENGYGVIADTIVGNLILSKKVGIYNEDSSIQMGEKGIVITTDESKEAQNQPVFTIQKKYTIDGNEILVPTMYFDSNGDVVLSGSVKIASGKKENIFQMDDFVDTDDINQITEQLNKNIEGKMSSIQADIDGIRTETSSQTSTLQELQKSVTTLESAADGIDIKVQNIIDNGTTKVVTGKGFYFGDEGMIISNPNSDLTHLSNETGDFVRLSGEIITKTDKDGFEGVNVKARKYLMIGQNCRIEDYNNGTDSNRTAVFYIGG